MKKVGIFIDLSNLYYSTRERHGGRKPSYKAIYDYCAALGVVSTAKAYGVQLGGSSHNFTHAIQKMGYTVQYKTPKRTGRVTKANCDIDLAIDVIDTILDVGLDMVVLGTADGDFAPLITWCTKRGITVIVLGCNISFELKAVTNHCIELPESMVEQR